MSKASVSRARPVARPLYSQVQQCLLDRISGREWGPGETLPNELTLAAEFDVSVGTVRKAVEKLQDAGVLVRQQGRGTFIAGRGASALDQRFDRLRLARSGVAPSIERRVLEHRSRPLTPVEKTRFLTGVGDEGLVITQAVSSKGRRIGWEQSVLQAARFPGFTLGDGQSLYGLMSDRGALATRVHDRVSVVRVDAPMAERTSLLPGDLAFVVDRRTFDLHDDVIELRTTVYAGPEFIYEAAT